MSKQNKSDVMNTWTRLRQYAAVQRQAKPGYRLAAQPAKLGTYSRRRNHSPSLRPLADLAQHERVERGVPVRITDDGIAAYLARINK